MNRKFLSEEIIKNYWKLSLSLSSALSQFFLISNISINDKWIHAQNSVSAN